MKTTSVLNYSATKVRRKLLGSLRKHKESTVADLVASTGLPIEQIKQEITPLVFQYRGRMQVTESGEILYSFPRGFRNVVRGPRAQISRLSGKIIRAVTKAGVFVFKAAIMVMLVGYFVFFIGLMILALLASIFAQSNNRSSGRGGFGGVFLTSRIINLFIRIWFYSSLSKEISGNGRSRRPAIPSRRDPNRKPLHHSIFDYVFGNGDPNHNKSTEIKTALAGEIQRKKGVVTLEETMAATGLSPEESDRLLAQTMLEWEGSPEASSRGTLIYRFPALMNTRRKASGALSPWKPVPQNKNPRRLNRIITAMNGVNIALGGYFFFYSFLAGESAIVSGFSTLYRFLVQILYPIMGNPIALIGTVFGIVPLVFSALFFLIPGLRKFSNQRKNKNYMLRNLRTRIYRSIVENPRRVRESALIPENKKATGWIEYRNKTLTEAAAVLDGEPEKDPEGEYLYRFDEVERHLSDVQELRRRIEITGTGATVFDTDA